MGPMTTLIVTIALQMGFDPNMAVAVAMTESSLRPDVIGGIGEIGLFQLRPEFHAPSCVAKNIKKSYVFEAQKSVYEQSIASIGYPSRSVIVKSKKRKIHVCGQELFDPETNIRIAIAYLKETQKKFSSFGKFGFLVAYNMGHIKGAKVKNPETYKYAVKASANYAKFKSSTIVAGY